MSGSPVVDVHAHASETKALGAWSTRGYEIWEYGERDGVAFGSFDGDLDDLETAMEQGGVDHAIVVNSFSVDEWRDRSLSGPRDDPWLAAADDPGPLAERLFAFNRWLVGAVGGRPAITPFVAVDPWVATLEEMARHLEEMRAVGAAGVKVHPPEQRFVPSDPRVVRLFRRCAALGMPVLSHSGPARGPIVFAEPKVFDQVLREVPGLQLVVAHLGGASWKQAGELAAAHPSVVFDCSEIVAWLGAPNAPEPTELVALIREIGIERVLFGSDFPWYDPGTMADLVRGLPGLSEAEAAAVLGENAVRILEVPA